MIRKAMLLSICGLLLAGAAMASVPSKDTSTIPGGIRLVGTLAGVADPLGQFSITVRDILGSVIPNSAVVVDVSACTPDIKIQSTQPYAGLTVDCATKTVRALTNASGVATMRIVGRSTSGAFSTFLSGKVYADGVLLGSITVSSYDLDGASGVGGNDLSLLATDYFAGNLAERSDLDFSGGIGGNDLSLLATGYFAGGSAVSATPLCP
jgi:hypothetical protein